MSDQQPPSGDIVGTVINLKYQVLQRLSQGGMGVVYKARHLMLDAPVALKILLKPESEEAQQRFLSEARLATKIRHPNTVYIADFGVLEDGRAFLEMEFLDGRTLAAELTKGPLEVLRACQVAMQMARGLQAVHDKGIVHRDMKPDNVFLLEQDGTKDYVKIVDFGIAKAAQRDSPSGPRPAMAKAKATTGANTGGQQVNVTQMGMVMGTPGFMAPEQVQGWPVSFRVDQYALGCILYEMIAGQPVFTSTGTQGLLMKHVGVAPQSLRVRCPQLRVSKRLDALVLRLLAKHSRERFGSMREVEEALQAEIDRLLMARGQRPTGTLAVVGPRRLQVFGVQVPLWMALAVPALICVLALGYAGTRWLSQGKLADRSSSQQSRELLELRQRAIALLRQDLQGGAAELRATAMAALGQTGDGALRGDLEALLKSPELATRAQAAAALGSLGDRRAVPALAALLQGAEPPGPKESRQALQQVRVAAAEALRLLGDPRGARFLEQALDSPDQDAQLRAALLFCAQGPSDVQRILRAYLQRSGLPEGTVLSILSCAARAGNATALERLHNQLNEVGPPEQRLAAAVRLAQLGDGEGLKYLRELVHKRGRDHLIAARELALLDERDGLVLLREVADNQSAQSLARQLGCDGLGGIGEPPDARQLAGLFAAQEQNDLSLKQAAARAVVRISGRDPGQLSLQSLSWAQTALGDSDALVRQSAVSILGDNVNAGAVSLLTGLLKDADPQVRRGAVTALGRRKDVAAVRALRESLRDSDKGVRLDSLRALLRLGEVVKAAGSELGALRQWLTALLAQAPTPATLGERVLAASVLLRLGDTEQLKRLQKALTAPEAEVRRLALEQLTLSADELVALLTDKAAEIRYLAARKLGELRDSRAEPVLRELVALKGADAAWAYTLLLRLGGTVPETDPLAALLGDNEPAKRVQAIEALRQRPVAQALPLLQQAARDGDMAVRWSVAEVAAELAGRPEGDKALAIMRRLAEDRYPMVRARAAALLAQLLAKKPPKADAEPGATAALPRTAGQPAALSPSDGGLRTGQAEPGVGTTPVAPALPGPLTSASARDEAAAVQIEKLVQAGLDSFEQKDFKKAQRQMAKALALCSRERGRGGPCAAFSFDMLYRLGQIHEQQKALPEAMSEYQQVVALIPQVRGRADIKAQVQVAVSRLAPRLGQIIVPKRTKRGCQEETIWMRQGTHSIRVDSKFEQIEVKPQGVVRVGSCS